MGDPLDCRCEDPNLKALADTRAALRQCLQIRLQDAAHILYCSPACLADTQ